MKYKSAFLFTIIEKKKTHFFKKQQIMKISFLFSFVFIILCSSNDIVVDKHDAFYATRVLQELQMSDVLIQSAIQMTMVCSNTSKCVTHSPCILCNDIGRINVKIRVLFFFFFFGNVTN